MKKWLITFCAALLVGAGAGAAEAERSVFYTVKQGDTLLSRFGPKAASHVAQFNNLKNWNAIFPGQKLWLPENVRAREDVMGHGRVTLVKRSASSVAAKGEVSCITLGAAPFNPEHRLARTLEGIDFLTKLSPEQKALAKEKVLLGDRASEKELVGQQVFTEMLYQSKWGKKAVMHVYGKPICSSEQGGQPEIMTTYDLGKGVFLSVPDRCGNPSVFEKPVRPEEPVTPPPPPPAASAPPETPTEPQVPRAVEPEPEAAVIEDDWDLGFFAGGDKDARYGGGEGAYYPFLKYAEWGRYALGVGGSFSLWEGGTSDGYVYGGRTGAFGLAQKFSFNNRRDLGIKFPMIGGLWERGHDASGKYQQRRFTELLCASVSYTDASREKDGKTVLPEWQIWGSYCNALNQSKSHSYEGKALDSSLLPDNQYVLGVGGRVFLSKNLGDEGLAAKLQPFVELGANKTAPNDPSGHAYVGLRTVNKVWGCGAGLHFADVGRTPGATCTYDAGRHYKLHVQEERWNAMIKAVEALGVATD